MKSTTACVVEGRDRQEALGLFIPGMLGWDWKDQGSLVCLDFCKIILSSLLFSLLSSLLLLFGQVSVSDQGAAVAKRANRGAAPTRTSSAEVKVLYLTGCGPC